MRIPGNVSRAIWAGDIIAACTKSRSQRIARGIAYRNIFLTGDESGVPQTFLRTQDFIQDVRSFLYSPSDLRFAVDYFGQVSPAERAKGKAAAAFLYQHISQANIDDAMTDVVLWSLIKGKTIQQTTWTRTGLESYLIQPEMFGVYNESISSLERQEAFVHTTFPTKSRFRQMISGLSEKKQAALMRAAEQSTVRGREGEDQNSTLKQIVVGGLAPYTTSGSQQSASRGMVNHLFAPEPSMQATLVDQLVPMDELWFWNDDQDDWATITMVGDTIVFGEDALFNAFSSRDPRPNKESPLYQRHGFVDFCPMPLDGYFWGWSYIQLVALIQKSLNCRIDGINWMLRKQEDPPRYMSGSNSVNQNAYAKLNKPGGYFTDSSPSVKIQDMVQPVPPDVWRSFHELNSMFDTIGGMPPIMRGEGEGSVRSQGQADALLRTGGARHKDASLKVERSVERVGANCFALLQAKTTDDLTAWVMPNTKSIETDWEPDPFNEAPAPGMQPITFSLLDISPRAKIAVDSHSASPAFRQEARELAFALHKVGAASPQRVVEMVHPTSEDSLIEDIERQQIERAALIASHPELLSKGRGKPKI